MAMKWPLTGMGGGGRSESAPKGSAMTMAENVPRTYTNPGSFGYLYSPSFSLAKFSFLCISSQGCALRAQLINNTNQLIQEL